MDEGKYGYVLISYSEEDIESTNVFYHSYENAVKHILSIAKLIYAEDSTEDELNNILEGIRKKVMRTGRWHAKEFNETFTIEAINFLDEDEQESNINNEKTQKEVL